MITTIWCQNGESSYPANETGSLGPETLSVWFLEATARDGYPLAGHDGLHVVLLYSVVASRVLFLGRGTPR